MDKKLIKQLYERGDRKRKLALSKHYFEWIFMDVSLRFITERINRDLGFDLVTERDIKYVRHHFANKTPDFGESANRPRPPIYPGPLVKNADSEMMWTDPDGLANRQVNLKSKFSKYDEKN